MVKYVSLVVVFIRSLTKEIKVLKDILCIFYKDYVPKVLHYSLGRLSSQFLELIPKPQEIVHFDFFKAILVSADPLEVQISSKYFQVHFTIFPSVQ